MNANNLVKLHLNRQQARASSPSQLKSTPDSGQAQQSATVRARSPAPAPVRSREMAR